MMRGQWGRAAETRAHRLSRDPVGFRDAPAAADRADERGAPVAVSSTVFLFFVGSVLDAEGWEGGLLILYFLAAAGTIPIWSRLAARYGERPVLLVAMALAIATFSVVLTLEAGDVGLFAAICFMSGALIGADFAILPALFARRMADIAPEAGAAFGLWAFVQKAALALAAATMLPALDAVGFSAAAGPENSAEALQLLTWLYALVPCILKLGAMALLAMTRLPAPQPATA
jgi:GPH family glycoside/pentoside/hexuronide:cation symporter